MIKFSIVIPCYNSELFLERCLFSCLDQDYPQYEIVCVDDFSTDGTYEKVLNFIKIDSKVKCIKNSRNLGTFHSRRVGLDNSTGDYIIFLDSDDQLNVNSLSKLSASILGKPDIIFNDVVVNLSSNEKSFLLKAPIIGNNLAASFINSKTKSLGTPGKIYKRSVLNSAYKYLSIPSVVRLVFAEDLLLLLSAIINSKRGYTISQQLYIYNLNDFSISNKNDAQDISFKESQIVLVGKFIDDIRDKCLSELEVRLVEYFKRCLDYDRLILTRFQNESTLFYTSNLFKAFLLKRKLNDLIKILLALISLGFVKY